MFDVILKAIFFSVIFSYLLSGIINLFRSNMHDMRQAKLRYDLARHPYARQLRRRLLISIVVFASNDAPTIAACLKSIINSSYRKTEVIVIDNASRDGTKGLIRAFTKAHPKKSLRLVAKRQAANRADAIASHLKSINGELVMVMDASCVLDKHALRHMVTQMSQDNVSAALPNIRVNHGYRLLGLANQLRSIATIWTKKAGGFISPAEDSYNYAAMYRRNLALAIRKPKNRSALDILNQLHQQDSGIAYDNHAIIQAYKAPVLKPRLGMAQPLNSTRSLLAMLEPVVIGFMLFVAFKFHSPGYILLAWLSFTSLLLLSIWTDDSQGPWPKLSSSLLAVIAYSLHLLQSTASICIYLYDLTIMHLHVTIPHPVRDRA